MTDSADNAALNLLLVDVGRSLLQYTADAWPWTGADGDVRRDQIDNLIDRQAAIVQRIAEHLDAREWPVDFGVFPDYSDLNFLSLDFLLKHIADNADAVLAEAEAARKRVAGDVAADLVDTVVGEQKQIVAELRKLIQQVEAA